MITHRSLVNFTINTGTEYELGIGDRVLQFASLAFDTSAEEIFPCLVSGGTLVLRTDQMLSSVKEFLLTCTEWGITVVDLPTAYWHEIAAELEVGVSTVRTHLHSIYVKLHVNTRTEAVVKFLRR